MKKFGKLSTTAVLAVAALGVTAGTAHAEPAVLDSPALVQGVDQGVGYETGIDEDGDSLTTVLDAGTFRLDKGADVIEVVDAEGAVVGSVPLSYRVNDQEFSIESLIGDNGRSLTLTPETDPAKATTVASVALTDINSAARFSDELNRASFGGGVGAAVGAGIGLVVGCVVGVFVGCIPGVLIGAAVGGVAGLVNTGGQPLIDAGYQYFTGQP
ncbi:hypothetical protein [Rhodococcus sp. NPDC058521]|uniref:hypothetical protein n=1 Tax=Rhodococcus sp. NPDC058521 TaxID=3346536 RepID=UPI0036563E1E